VKVAVLAAGAVADVEHLLGGHRQGPGGAVELSLLVGVSFALPSDEDAARAQQRAGELGQGRKAADGAGGDHVIGLAVLLRARQVLGTSF
jgi:hypothetical protein